jgi:uncharacterized protein with HEPN domain
MKHDVSRVLAKHISELDMILKQYAIKEKSDLVSKAEDDIVFQRAVLMSVGYIGELSKKLDDEIRLKNPQIHWRRLSNSRNIIFHDYDIVDIEIISSVIFSDIKKLGNLLTKETTP